MEAVSMRGGFGFGSVPHDGSTTSMPKLLLLITCMSSVFRSTYGEHVADLCDNAPVQTAAHLVFRDGIERYFVSTGSHYWFLNVTDQKPDAQSAFRFPYNFRPDVAIRKNTRNCKEGNDLLLLIQFKLSDDSNEVEWLTLEMKIGNWHNNETGPEFWSQVNKIAHCDLEVQVCTTTDNYFATMSFDFKRKLDSAFGTIGETAYFIQGRNMYRVIYRTQCISNPYKEVIAYDAVDIGTTTTAALAFTHDGNESVIAFDHDLHRRIDNITLDDVDFGDRVANIDEWQDNVNFFFVRCPIIESTFSFLSIVSFSRSSKHFFKKQNILIISAIVLLCLIAIIVAIFAFNLVRKPNNKRSLSANEAITDEQLIEQSKNSQINPENENGEQRKTLLQTSC